MIRRVNTKNMILTAFFTALIAVGAFIKIPNPFFPVPFTLQGVFCACGASSRLKIRLTGGYRLHHHGASRLACVHGTSRPSIYFSAHFRLFTGFIATAYIIGKVSELNEEFTYTKAFASSYAGLFVQYALGISYMYVIYNFYNKSPIGFWALVSAMSLYFLKDIILYSVVASVSVVLRKSLSPILQER